MEKQLDFSIHFTIKGQSVEEIFNKIKTFQKENPDALDLNYRPGDGVVPVLHHCFMRKADVQSRGFDTTLCDKLAELSQYSICWNGVSQNNLEEDRALMLRNLKKVGGTAVFVGNIIEGVQDEYNLALFTGCKILRIS